MNSYNSYSCCYCGCSQVNNLLLSCQHYICKSYIWRRMQLENDVFLSNCSCQTSNEIDLTAKPSGNSNMTFGQNLVSGHTYSVVLGELVSGMDVINIILHHDNFKRMMMSDIYKACEDGDVDLLKVLIDTSPSDFEINRLEANGNTALHIACKKDHEDIVKLLLYKYNVDPDKLNIDNRTAFEETLNDNIRQLFYRLKKDKYRFCSDENIKNPLEIITDKEHSRSYWLNHYPNDSSILTELYSDVLDQPRNIFNSFIDKIKSFFGNDPYKKSIEQWSNYIQSFIDQTLKSSSSDYSCAYHLLQTFKETDNIESLLTLYTLNKNLCEFISKTHHNTNCFYAPIKSHLFSIEYRSFKGESYRGLTMTKEDFQSYIYAFQHKQSYVQTNTFCSTSIDLSVAQGFADSGDTNNNKIKVLIQFNFIEPCSTAVILHKNPPYFQSISNFDEELEVLILPKTIFSVKNIQQNNHTELSVIYLEHYDTEEQKAQMAQERLQSYIDNILLD